MDGTPWNQQELHFLIISSSDPAHLASNPACHTTAQCCQEQGETDEELLNCDADQGKPVMKFGQTQAARALLLP